MTDYFRNKKVIVTGAGGFIGFHICELLVESGAHITAVVRNKSKIQNLKHILSKINVEEVDLRNKKYLKKIMKNGSIVIHAAAIDGGNIFKRKHASKIFHDNVHMTMNVFESLNKSTVEKILFVSSAEVYLNLKNKSKIKEEHFRLSEPLRPEQWYAFSKMIGEYTAQLIGSSLGVKVIIVRPANIYGPRDSAVKGRLVPTLLDAIRKKKKIVKLTGTGKDTRSFLYVTDYARNILGLLEHSNGGIYNIAGSKPISIDAFTKLFTRYSQTKFIFKDKRNITVNKHVKFVLDVKKIKQTIPQWYDGEYKKKIKETIESI